MVSPNILLRVSKLVART